MAITIDWDTREITVPLVDTTLVGTDAATGRQIRQLDLDTFRQALNALQASEAGMSFSTTHVHVAPSVAGSATLARVVTLVNGYFVTFEDGQYAVNIVGGNSNVAEATTVNQVSIRPQNSAGLVQVTSGSGVLPSDVTDIANAVAAGRAETDATIAGLRALMALQVGDQMTIAHPAGDGTGSQVASGGATWSVVTSGTGTQSVVRRTA